MNAVWTMAEQHRDLFPGDSNPGRPPPATPCPPCSASASTTIIDLNGFRSLVDAMGGVNVNVKERIPIGGHVNPGGTISGITGWIEAGPQHLNGRLALWFSRSRATTDDFSRMRRQRCMAGALVDQVNPVTMLEKYPALAAVAKNNIQSDISQNELPAFVDLVQRIQKGGSIRSLPLTANVVRPGNPDFAKIRKLVKKGLKPPAASTVSTSPTPTPTTTKSGKPAPTRTAAPDDSKAESLTATC